MTFPNGKKIKQYIYYSFKRIKISTYTGLHYGIYLNAKNLTSEDDIESYYDGEKKIYLENIELKKLAHKIS